jgi:hypothetical protein
MIRMKNLVPLVLIAATLQANCNRAAAALLDPSAFTSQGSLSLTSGTLTFNTDTLQVSGGGAGVTSTAAVLFSPAGSNPDVAVFDFSNVLVGSGVTVQVTGARPIAILSQSSLQIDANLDLSGANGAAGVAPGNPSAPNGSNGAGGCNGCSGGGTGGPQPLATEFGGKGGDGGYNNGNGASGAPGSGSAMGGTPGIATGQAFDQSGFGGKGQTGSSAFQGTPGTGGIGAIGGASFAIVGGSAGVNGTKGGNGKGGGGGGGGGGGSCVVNGFCSANADRGGGGGAGGAGGLGGNFGAGGVGGQAIGLGAVGSVAMNGNLVALGGSGGNGAVGQLGGTGGAGGAAADDAGGGGLGGNGGAAGAGAPGGGGAGGTVYLFGGAVHAPQSLVNLNGGTRATNPSGEISSPGADGLFRFDGTLALDVTSTSLFDRVNVDGRIDPSGAVKFNFATDAIANLFASNFTLDSFFVQHGSSVPDVTEFSDLTFSASSPSANYAIQLNPDRTFSITHESLLGDYNGNGIVETADYVVWRKGLGTTYVQADYNVWRTHFGQTTGSGSGAIANAAVPEPTTFVLLIFTAAGCCLLRNRAA